MSTDENMIGGNTRDNSPLDAFLKGEQISPEQAVLLKLELAFAEKARARNEHQDFEDKGCQRTWSAEDRTRWQQRMHRESAFETSTDSFYAPGKTRNRFNMAAAGESEIAAPTLAAMAGISAPKTGLTV